MQNIFMNLHQLSLKKSLNVVGIMNGTSLDGVDFVQTKIFRAKNAKGQPKIQYLAEKSFSFPANLKARLKQAAKNEMKVRDLGLLHHDLGRFYATCYSKLPAKMKKNDLIGLHGQTVFHQAPQATLQIGEASYLQVAANIPVIADFRVADMALGGQGAPIATLFHSVVFGQGERISVHNLGGISNMSIVNRHGVELAFDTGPANMLLDLCVQKSSRGKKSFDKDGKIAAKGQAQLGLVADLLGHKYFNSRPPKSCGREEFGEIFLDQFFKKSKGLSIEDKMATLLEFTAWTIALSYQKYVKPLPKRIVFCGGGANNKTLLKRVGELLPGTEIKTTQDYKWPVSAIEGAAFALLAAYRIWDQPSNFPRTTGARKAKSLGKIV